MNPCIRCRARLGNDGIPKFYHSTESDAGGIYPAKVVCEQCRFSVASGTTYASAAVEWNHENDPEPTAVGNEEPKVICKRCGFPKGLGENECPDGVSKSKAAPVASQAPPPESAPKRPIIIVNTGNTKMIFAVAAFAYMDYLEGHVRELEAKIVWANGLLINATRLLENGTEANVALWNKQRAEYFEANHE